MVARARVCVLVNQTEPQGTFTIQLILSFPALSYVTMTVTSASSHGVSSMLWCCRAH